MKKLLNILAFVMLGISGSTYAECKFYAGNDSVLIMSPGTQPVITPLPVGTVTTPTQISSPFSMETTPTLKSHCAGGNDGWDVYQLTNNAMLAGGIDGKAMFRTNIPGIYYTLAFYPDGDGLTAWFPENANAFYKTASPRTGVPLSEKNWHVRMEIWQTNGFTGVPSSENFLTASGGPIGQIIIGDPREEDTYDHPRPYVNMSEMSFNIPLNRPTCALRAPTTVNLGDWYPAELANDNTNKVEFHVTGTCVNTTAVYYTLSSTHTTTDKKYFTNTVESSTSGVTAAGGVGVMILDSSKSNYPVPANGPKYVIAMGENFGDPVYNIDRSFWAKLVKIGSDPVTVGVFGTTVTFQATYE